MLRLCCPTKHALPILFAAWKQRSWAAICEFRNVWPLWTFSRAAFPRQVLCPANQPSPLVLLRFSLEVMVKGQSFLLTKAWACRLLCIGRIGIACCFLRQSPLASCWPQTHYRQGRYWTSDLPVSTPPPIFWDHKCIPLYGIYTSIYGDGGST